MRTVVEAEAAEEAFFSRSRSLYATQPDKSALALANRSLPADAPAGREDEDTGLEWQDADEPQVPGTTCFTRLFFRHLFGFLG